MHWYNPDLPHACIRHPACNGLDPIALPRRARYAIHELLYGDDAARTTRHRSAAPIRRPPRAAARCRPTSRLEDGHDPPAEAGEATTAFYDLPALRSGDRARARRRRAPGFFTTPAFFANWPTNTVNQMRVTHQPGADRRDRRGGRRHGRDDAADRRPGSTRRTRRRRGVLRLPPAARSDALDPVEHVLVVLLPADRSDADARSRACSRSRA